MGLLSNIFGNTSQTQNTQSSSGTSTTQNNLWPQLQNFWQQYQNQFAQAPNANVPVTPYQYAAANNQMGATAYSPLAQATGANIAANGIQPSSISSFMSPYISNVVDATRNDFNTQNARQLSSVAGQAAKAGAWGGTQGAVAKNLAMESQRRTQDPIIANLYNQGYGQAADLANKDINARLGGIGAINQTTGATTGANTGLSGIGQGIWGSQYQNTMLPYNLTTQGASGLAPFMQAAGQTTTNNQTGYSTGTKTDTNSPWNIGTNLMGGALSFFKDGGRVGYAEGGSVLPESYRPQVEPFHEKVEKAFHTLHRMKSMAKGGSVLPHYDAGGEVPFGAWDAPAPNGSETPAMTPYDPAWRDTVVERAPQETGFDRFKTWLGRQNQLTPYQGQGQPPPKDTSLADAAGSLRSFMHASQPQGFADGGAPWDIGEERPSFGSVEAHTEPSYAGLGATPAAAPSAPGLPPERSWSDKFRDFLGTRRGAIAGEDLTPANRAGVIVAGMGIGPVGPGQVGESILALQKNRQAEMAAKRDADRVAIERGRLGIERGRFGLETERNPHVIDQLKAHSIAGQKAIKEFEYTTQKDLQALQDLRKREAEIDDLVLTKYIRPEEAATLKAQARDLYERSRGMIREAPKAPAAAAPPAPPRKWSPDGGLE